MIRHGHAPFLECSSRGDRHAPRQYSTRSAAPRAKVILGFGTDPETRKLAQDVITAQQGEIDEMKALLAS